MRLRWNLLFGLILILVGGFFLFDGIFHWRVDFGDFLGFLWPVVLIFLGIYLLLQRSLWGRCWGSAESCTRAFGDMKLDAAALDAKGLNAEIGVGDILLDLTKSTLPEKELRILLHTGVGDIKMIVPPDTPVSARGSTGIGSVDILGKTSGGMGSTVFFESEHYRDARRKLSVEIKTGIGDIHLARSET